MVNSVKNDAHLSTFYAFKSVLGDDKMKFSAVKGTSHINKNASTITRPPNELIYSYCWF